MDKFSTARRNASTRLAVAFLARKIRAEEEKAGKIGRRGEKRRGEQVSREGGKEGNGSGETMEGGRVGGVTRPEIKIRLHQTTRLVAEASD